MVEESHKLVVVGGGPAALTAALYASRSGLEVQVFERKGVGGLLGEISQLSNYPGFEGAGSNLADTMRHQAEAAGARIDYGECSAVRPLTDGRTGFELIIDGAAVRAGTVLVATGAEPKPLPFAVTPPVSYCALCDGALAKGQDIVVVGGANAAVQESLYLAKLAKSVTIVTHSRLKADPVLIKQLKELDNIKIIENVEPTPDLLNRFSYVFVFIGHTPATKFLQDLNKSYHILNDKGYILTGESTMMQNNNQQRSSFDQSVIFHHLTAVPGLFAAGDVRASSIRQVVTAAGDGASAAIEISAWLS